MTKIINIGFRREILWDDYIIDLAQTTALKRIHHPIRKEKVMQLDAPWEGSLFFFGNIFKDNDIYRMYYHTSVNSGYLDQIPSDARERRLGLVNTCLATSKDGIHWERPNLGVCKFYGFDNNNLIITNKGTELYETSENAGPLFVLKDPNPNCPKDELYKALHGCWHDGVHELRYLASSDGVHFRHMRVLYTAPMYFDSLNTLHYDLKENKYRCYFRGWHKAEYRVNESTNNTRNICYMESPDFVTWSKPKPIVYINDKEDFHMYTNAIAPYYRAPHILIGFPSRYVEKTKWSDNFDELCGKEDRISRMDRFNHQRFGLAVTDTLFMTSRDGFHFERNNDAFIRPEIEHDWNWGYGECYVSTGLFEVPSDLPGAFPELSMLLPFRNLKDDIGGAWLYRYSIRPDGFVSRYAGYEEKTLVTKPFTFEGDNLYINFETSAAGHIYIEILDAENKPIEGYKTDEIFGNTIDRKVHFPKNINKLSGVPIRLKFSLSDADIYSFKFEKHK